MSNPQLALLMLGLFIFIIMLGFPIAFTLMAMGVMFGFYAYFTPDQAFFDNDYCRPELIGCDFRVAPLRSGFVV